MKILIKKAVFYTFLSLILTVNYGVFAQTTTVKGEVVGIVDGDTITLFDSKNKRQITIRLAGIDAPEKTQDFGEAARQKLADLIFNKKVSVVISKQDRYGRSIGKIFLNGTDINLLMVQSGFAWHYKEYENEQPETDRTLYATAEIKARESNSGLWIMPDPVKPSDFRRKKREESAAAKENKQVNPRNARIILPVSGDSGLNEGGGSSSSSPSDGKEKTVNVRGYTRKDGTVVAPYKRSKPNN